MLVIVGMVVVTGCVLGGYVLHGGKLGVLVQPTEYLIIGGAAIGSMIISTPLPHMKDMVHQILNTLKKPDPTKADYIELLVLLFELCKTAKGNPLALEPHVENPSGSEIFKKYPGVLKNHHAIHFLCDTLKVQLSASMSPFDLEELMDKDIQSTHGEENKAVDKVNMISDALPGLGIVAAVLGVIITMGKLSEGKEVIGHSVAAALVGTFLGIFMAYGFGQPLAKKMEENLDVDGKYFEVIKQTLLAFAKDCSPKVCVEFGRRSVPPLTRPGFEELDQATSNAK